MTEKTIPLLPCRAIQPVVDFYTALGFETTYLQKSPYPYAAVRRGPVELQFFGMKDYDPAGSYSGVYIVTDDVDALHETFRNGLKEAYGRIPRRGLPRIGPLKDMSYGMRQFLMSDPGGNSVRVGQEIAGDKSMRPAPRETFAKALHLADLFADSKEDLPGAARIVDRALARQDVRPTPVQLLRLLVLRGDIAGRLGDEARAAAALERAEGVELSAAERREAADALARLRDLRD
ncbi:bleomycin resistance protein [Streptomyces genisteinicus]|uniref:VOC family protein n=1 Tax=Streptomyces genisteinicus TaxID=2768068 RepID=A0A7H0HVF9_9ACTN|nr:VOC family protein [Streptomyces genisteinicus]QNP64525.1 VOC family protein [Streptomyces genisteinicus]